MPTVKLTEARLRVLRDVDTGVIEHRMKLKGMKDSEAGYRHAGVWQTPRQSVFVWLEAEGLIRKGAPNMHGTQVLLTAAGRTALEENADRPF
ncbi:hypothetical protein ACFVAJ_19210 [Agromyces sp. NPDC057679]|uniref:hypothetical protein n=1 Tax=Agromyces sp. NPDC057679 TaxID=3346207 RepID=UPI00366FCC97